VAREGMNKSICNYCKKAFHTKSNCLQFLGTKVKERMLARDVELQDLDLVVWMNLRHEKAVGLKKYRNMLANTEREAVSLYQKDSR
jgi:hypothetical protein